MRINEAKRNIVLTTAGAMAVITAMLYSVLVMDSGIIITLLIFIASTSILVAALWHYKKFSIETQFYSAEKETRRRLILLNEANALLWYYNSKFLHFTTRLEGKRGVIRTRYSNEEFRRLIAPESIEALMFLRSSISKKGSYHVRLKMALDETNTAWHWYELCYTVTDETIRKHILTGLTIVIDDVVQKEEEMIIAERQKNEIKAKEAFIENIGEEMLAPFETIKESSERIINDNGKLTKEEKGQMGKVIRTNTDTLLNIINKVARNSMAR